MLVTLPSRDHLIKFVQHTELRHFARISRPAVAMLSISAFVVSLLAWLSNPENILPSLVRRLLHSPPLICDMASDPSKANFPLIEIRRFMTSDLVHLDLM